MKAQPTIRLVVLAVAAMVACDVSPPRSGDMPPPEPTPEPIAEESPPTAEPAAGDPRVPGVGRVDDALQASLREALAARGPDYRPRTHHLEEDGSPTYVNRLMRETSPYLLQHAHNPMNWFPWGEEAFARARAENKPVFLSIGYSTCHWCHVMERESFENAEIAAYINANFIPIKVDREERPDLDDIYMRAVQILTRRGGWPMTVVLTPDREPFFGGTYFPPEDARGRRGLRTILTELVERYRDDPEGVVADAQRLTRQIQSASRPRSPGNVPGASAIENVSRGLAGRFDPVWGGFGRAPKFPQPSRLAILLRYARRTQDPGAHRMIVHTLDKMSQGGMYDHVGGGFHRYSTDTEWLTPHFEKMLYDNAQLVDVYLAGYQLTGHERFARVAREVLDYVGREMTNAEGAFYSATDADSPAPGGHDEEGWFFTWTPAEIVAVVGPERARIVNAWYGVSARGNFEGRNIFRTWRSEAEVAQELGVTGAFLRREVAAANQQLYDVRATRPPPIRDDKVLTAWNGLMVGAFARGALVLGDASYAERGSRAAAFLLRELRGPDGRLMRSYMDGRARHNGFLDDHAFLIHGLLDLYEATSERRWLEASIALQRDLDAHFGDADNGGYFATRDDHEQLLAREKPSYDGALPSGNSVAAMNLLRLAEWTGDESYRTRCERLFAAFSITLNQGGVPRMAVALDYYLDTPLEIVLVSPDGGNANALLAQLRTTFLPNRILAVLEASEVASHQSLVPLLEGKAPMGGRTTAYVCERGRCELPTSNPRVFRQQISRVQPLREGTIAPLSVPSPR